MLSPIGGSPESLAAALLAMESLPGLSPAATMSNELVVAMDKAEAIDGAREMPELVGVKAALLEMS